MSILREWRAEIRRATSAAYVEYVQSTGIVEYRRTPGNLGAVVAVRDLDESRQLDFPVFARSITGRTARGRIVEVSTGEYGDNWWSKHG